MLLLGTIAVAIALVISSSAALSGLSIQSFVVHAGIVVAVHGSLRRPFYEAALAMLVVAYLADLMASGPPGLYGLTLTLVFFATFGLAQRVGGRYLLATFGLAFGASMVLDLTQGLLIGLVYPDVPAMRLFAIVAIPNALATALVAVPYTVGVALLERLWVQRTQRSVVVD